MTTIIDFDSLRRPEKDKTVVGNKDNKKYYKEIGQRLKNAREQSKLTLADVASIVGLTSTAISNYESGNRQVPVHQLVKLSSIYEKPIDFFIGPSIRIENTLQEILTKTLGQYINAEYISHLIELKDGDLVSVEEPKPLIPLPHEFANDYDYAIRSYNMTSDTYNYYLCKSFSPYNSDENAEPEEVPLDPGTLVLAEVGDSGKYEIVLYNDVTPSNTKSPYSDDLLDRVRSLVLSRVERLV